MKVPNNFRVLKSTEKKRYLYRTNDDRFSKY